MLRKEKENWVTGFKEKVGKYNTVILVSPSRVSVSDYEKAKRSVPSGVKIQVVKNRLAKIAFENTEFEAISSVFLKTEAVRVFQASGLKSGVRKVSKKVAGELILRV